MPRFLKFKSSHGIQILVTNFILQNQKVMIETKKEKNEI